MLIKSLSLSSPSHTDNKFINNTRKNSPIIEIFPSVKTRARQMAPPPSIIVNQYSLSKYSPKKQKRKEEATKSRGGIFLLKEVEYKYKSFDRKGRGEHWKLPFTAALFIDTLSVS